jgi:hypothetical protein
VLAVRWHDLEVQAATVGKPLAGFALGAFGVLAGAVGKGYLGEFLVDMGNSPRRSANYAPQKMPGCQKTHLNCMKQKSPGLRGFQGIYQINLDFSGCNFGGEGGIRTHGTLRYA